MADHLGGVGSHLAKAVEQYNQAIGSLEARVLVQRGASVRWRRQPPQTSRRCNPLRLRRASFRKGWPSLRLQACPVRMAHNVAPGGLSLVARMTSRPRSQSVVMTAGRFHGPAVRAALGMLAVAFCRSVPANAIQHGLAVPVREHKTGGQHEAPRLKRPLLQVRPPEPPFG